MKANTLEFPVLDQLTKRDIPVTPRGRALYTTDWFLNGRPVLRNHDNPRLTLRSGLSC